MWDVLTSKFLRKRGLKCNPSPYYMDLFWKTCLVICKAILCKLYEPPHI